MNLSRYRLSGLSKGDEHPVYTSVEVQHPIPWILETKYQLKEFSSTVWMVMRRRCLKRQPPVTCQTLPERSTSIRANGHNPRVWRTTQLGADTDVGVETKAEQKWAQQHWVVFTVLQNSFNTHTRTNTVSNETPWSLLHISEHNIHISEKITSHFIIIQTRMMLNVHAQHYF